MADLRLPEALRTGIEAMAGQGRPVAERAAALSSAYRARKASYAAVADADDIGAYLVTRVPATYAAMARALAELAVRVPDFVPESLLDAGAGPGTASWACAETFPSLAAITMLDHNRGLLDTAKRLAGSADNSALANAAQVIGSLTSPPPGTRDLVTAGYALTELPDSQVADAALALWAGARSAFVVVEPGRPRDYQRLMQIRSALIEAGARIVAPCAHHHACPLPQGDWCHFSVRVQRSRAHMKAKGGTLGYEDEKFSYLIAVRAEPIAERIAARVLRQPAVSKFDVAMDLCTPLGLERRVVQKRDGSAYKSARKLDWGDALD